MSRRGQCKCGTILVFERTAQGYKVRCPVCQAVVRLRSEKATQSSRPHGSAPPLPPMMAPASAPGFDERESPGEVGSLDLLNFQESSSPAAVVVMDVYRKSKAKSSRGIWLLLALAFVGLALGAIVLVLIDPF